MNAQRAHRYLGALMFIVGAAEVVVGVGILAILYIQRGITIPNQAIVLAASWVAGIVVGLVMVAALTSNWCAEREQWDRARNWKYIQVGAASVQLAAILVMLAKL